MASQETRKPIEVIYEARRRTGQNISGSDWRLGVLSGSTMYGRFESVSSQDLYVGDQVARDSGFQFYSDRREVVDEFSIAQNARYIKRLRNTPSERQIISAAVEEALRHLNNEMTIQEGDN